MTVPTARQVFGPAEKPAWLIEHEALIAAGREITDYHIACIQAENRVRLARGTELDGVEERVASGILEKRHEFR